MRDESIAEAIHARTAAVAPDLEHAEAMQHPRPERIRVPELWARVPFAEVSSTLAPYMRWATTSDIYADPEEWFVQPQNSPRLVLQRDHPVAVALSVDLAELMSEAVGAECFPHRATMMLMVCGAHVAPHYDQTPISEYAAAVALHTTPPATAYTLHSPREALRLVPGDVCLSSPFEVLHWSDPFPGAMMVRALIRYTVNPEQAWRGWRHRPPLGEAGYRQIAEQGRRIAGVIESRES